VAKIRFSTHRLSRKQVHGRNLTNDQGKVPRLEKLSGLRIRQGKKVVMPRLG